MNPGELELCNGASIDAPYFSHWRNRMDIVKLKKTIQQLKQCKKIIAAERDKLRDIQDDVECILGSAEPATEDLERVIDQLSEYM